MNQRPQDAKRFFAAQPKGSDDKLQEILMSDPNEQPEETFDTEEPETETQDNDSQSDKRARPTKEDLEIIEDITALD